jgi:hypothetical protein
LGFTPKWFHDRLGIDFSERWHLDPVYRYETLVQMKRYLHEAFPMVPAFVPNYDGRVERTCASVSGVHGAMFMPALYGMELLYREDMWPAVDPNTHLRKQELENLKPFDLEKEPLVQQLVEQMDVIESRWGPIHGYLNYQGTLNIAFKVRGADIFTDMYHDPDFVHSLFDHIAGTIRDLSEFVQSRQRESGFEVDLLSVGNCVMNMISPGFYERFMLPLDAMLSRSHQRFGIHTCNWDVTPYIDVLRKIGKVGYIDTGIMSDLKRVREVFPDARRNVLYHAGVLEKKTLEKIRQDIERISRDLAPCDIGMSNIDSTTPEEKVIEVWKIVQDVMEHGPGFE